MSYEFIAAVRKVAALVSTSAEAFRLVEYVRENLPFTTEEDTRLQLTALSAVADNWHHYGCYEDELAPAIGIICVIDAFSISIVKADSDALNTIRQRNEEMLANPDYDAPDMSYAEFCDKYAE
ncbi:MAG: hypothetical protein RSC65_04200, partial [Malacoplasma sp.]